jgi:hypothetical protein
MKNIFIFLSIVFFMISCNTEKKQQTKALEYELAYFNLYTSTGNVRYFDSSKRYQRIYDSLEVVILNKKYNNK